MREGVQQVIALLALTLCKHHQILCRLVETLTTDSPNIVVIGFSFLLGLFASLGYLLQLLFCLRKKLIHIVSFTVNFLSLVTDVDELERGCPEVLLQLAHITPLTEQSFGGRAELIFEDLFALEIGTFSTLHELVAIVFVSHFQVIKCVEQGFDLLLALLDLAVELITVPLKLLLLLGSLDDIVGLRMLALRLNFAAARLVALDETLVFDPQVLHLVVALLKLNLNLVAFLFCRLQLTDQDVFMHLDLLFTLLHRHLQLILSVLKAVDLVSSSVDFFAKTLNLKLHDVVLNERLFLLFDDRLEVATSHLVLQLELADDAVERGLLRLDLGNDAVNIPALILQLLVRSR